MSWTSYARKAITMYEDRRRSHRPVGEAWRSALDGEVGFWRKNLQTWKRLSERLDPTRPLRDDIAEYIDAEPGSVVRLLDVGAGPLTWLGHTHPSFKVEVTAVDALGDEYGKIIDEVGAEPPVRTQACDTERLSEMFAADTFDLAYARNTLDHSYEPLKAIEQMLQLVKPNACIMLEHGENVALAEKYLGMHQWNFLVEGDRFKIWRPGVSIDVAEVLSSIATLEVAHKAAPRDLSRVVLRKKS